MLTRISNITSFEHISNSGAGHSQSNPEQVTNICFHYQGEYYASRAFGHLTRYDIEVEEERFLERRHRRR